MSSIASVSPAEGSSGTISAEESPPQPASVPIDVISATIMTTRRSVFVRGKPMREMPDNWREPSSLFLSNGNPPLFHKADSYRTRTYPGHTSSPCMFIKIIILPFLFAKEADVHWHYYVIYLQDQYSAIHCRSARGGDKTLNQIRSICQWSLRHEKAHCLSVLSFITS